ncbi:bacteriorhodopsin [Sphingomonas aurantiaca]
MGPLRMLAKSRGMALVTAYNKNVAFLTVIWFLYPIVFLIGPEGMKIITDPTSVWAILIMDVVAKVVYAFYAASNLDKALEQLAPNAVISHDRPRSSLGLEPASRAAAAASISALTVQLAFAVVAIGFIGMAHGASDLAIVEPRQRPLFVALYVLVGAVCLCWWVIDPAVALPAFSSRRQFISAWKMHQRIGRRRGWREERALSPPPPLSMPRT